MDKEKLLSLQGVLGAAALYTNNPNTPEKVKGLAIEVATNALNAMKAEIDKS